MIVKSYNSFLFREKIKKILIFTIIISIIIVLLFYVLNQLEEVKADNNIQRIDSKYIYTYEDNNAICYIYETGNASVGISCVRKIK
jgi:hypothetical protein